MRFFDDPRTKELAASLLGALSQNQPVDSIVHAIRRHVRYNPYLSEEERYILLAATIDLTPKRASLLHDPPAPRQQPEPKRLRRATTVLLLGMVRTTHADQYASDVIPIDPTYFDTNERLGRDNIRIGELVKRGYEVFSVSADEHPDTVNHTATNFLSFRPSIYEGSRGFTSDVMNLLNGSRLDYVLDEWYYIPINYSRFGGSFYDTKKWYNIVQMKEYGLLNPGCRVIIPAHVNAVEALMGANPTAEELRKHIDRHFEWSYLTDGTDEMEENPLWKATQGAGTMERLPTNVRQPFRSKIAQNLRANYIPATQLMGLCEKGRRMFADASDRPAFIVLTAK